MTRMTLRDAAVVACFGIACGMGACSSSKGVVADGDAPDSATDAVSPTPDAPASDGPASGEDTNPVDRAADAKAIVDSAVSVDARADVVVAADKPSSDAAPLAACPGDKEPTPHYCQPSTSVACRLSDGRTCRCEAVCSGAPPAPGFEYAWDCPSLPPAGCPAEAPKADSPCAPDGLACTYGSCGVTIATCKGTTWTVRFLPPPP